MTKETRSQLRLTLLFLVLAALFLAAGLLLRSTQKETVSQNYVSEKMLGRVISLAFSTPSEEISFQLQDGVWVCVSDPAFSPDPSILDKVADSAKQMKATRILTDCADWFDRFQLGEDAPCLMATDEKGDHLTYRIGAHNASDGYYYVSCAGSTDAALVSETIAGLFRLDRLGLALSADISGLRADNVDVIHLRTAAEELEIRSGSSHVGYSREVYGVCADPLLANDAHAAFVISTICSTDFSRHVAFADAETLRRFGLDSPELSLELEYLPRSGIPAVFRLQLSAPDEAGTTYAFSPDTNVICQLSGSDSEKYRRFEESTYFLSPVVCSVSLDDVSSLSITTPDASGFVSPVVSAADEAASLLSLISSLTGEDWAGMDQPLPEEEMILRIDIQCRDMDPVHSLRFFPFDTNYYRVAFDSFDRYLVNRQDFRKLLQQAETFLSD